MLFVSIVVKKLTEGGIVDKFDTVRAFRVSVEHLVSATLTWDTFRPNLVTLMGCRDSCQVGHSKGR